jgi:hypothetical protein
MELRARNNFGRDILQRSRKKTRNPRSYCNAPKERMVVIQTSADKEKRSLGQNFLSDSLCDFERRQLISSLSFLDAFLYPLPTHTFRARAIKAIQCSPLLSTNLECVYKTARAYFLARDVPFAFNDPLCCPFDCRSQFNQARARLKEDCARWIIRRRSQS